MSVQSTYNVEPSKAFSGQLVSTWQDSQFAGKYQCSEDLPYGRVVELHTDGKWRLPQGTTLGKFLGVVLYQPSMSPGGYKAGDYPTVLRRGSIWVDNVGTAPVEPTDVGVKLNVSHSSTVATNRGKITLSATSASAGAEISALPEGQEFSAASTGISLITVNFPA